MHDPVPVHGSDTSGFASPDKGEAAAKGMLDKGADVIYAAAGCSGAGAIEAVAGQKGAWAIGVDSDQYTRTRRWRSTRTRS